MKELPLRKRIGKYLSKSHSKHTAGNKAVYIIPILSLITGVVIGTASALISSQDVASTVCEYLNNFFSVYSLQGVSRNEIFKISMYNNLKMLLIIWASGLSSFFIPFLAAYTAGKGFKLGFAISFLIKIYSYSGAFLSGVFMLPQALIIVPTIIIFSGYSIKLALSLKWIRANKVSNDEKRKIILSNLSAIALSAFAVIIAACIDSFIVPLISAPIYNSLGEALI